MCHLPLSKVGKIWSLRPKWDKQSCQKTLAPKCKIKGTVGIPYHSLFKGLSVDLYVLCVHHRRKAEDWKTWTTAGKDKKILNKQQLISTCSTWLWLQVSGCGVIHVALRKKANIGCSASFTAYLLCWAASVEKRSFPLSAFPLRAHCFIQTEEVLRHAPCSGPYCARCRTDTRAGLLSFKLCSLPFLRTANVGFSRK